MRIFNGNDAFLTTEYIVESLRSIAKDEGAEGEYPAEEHICWVAADALEIMDNVVKGKKPSLILEEIANWVKQYE